MNCATSCINVAVGGGGMTVLQTDILFVVQFIAIYFGTSTEKHVHTAWASLSRFCFLGPTPVLAPNVLANENPKVDTCSRESNSRPYDSETDALPHDHRHHNIL